MFEHFTIDVLAKRVGDQLRAGRPTSKLSYRFFRKGRRDGRRAFDHASVAKLLQDAVHLAGSSLVQEMATRRTELRSRIAECDAAIAHFAQLELPTDPDAPGSSAGVAPLPGVEQATHALSSEQVLLDALEARRRLTRQRRSAEDARRVAEVHAAQVATYQAASDRADAARRDRPGLDTAVHDLPQEYAQRFESMKHAAEMLWARYANGFVQGEAKRGSRSTDVEPPTGNLVFETPLLLRLAPTQPETGSTVQQSALAVEGA